MSLLRPLGCWISSLIDGSQKIDADCIDSWSDSEVKCEDTRDVWVLRIEDCQLSAYNCAVLGTTHTFLAEPESEAKPYMRRGKMDHHSMLSLRGGRVVDHSPWMRMLKVWICLSLDTRIQSVAEI